MLSLFPAVTVLISALLAVLPWGAGELVRAALAFLPVTVVHYWSARRPLLVPVPFVFLAGLTIDVLSHGPLGFWALMLLVSASLGGVEQTMFGSSSALGRCAAHIVTVAITALLGWGVASLYNGAWIATELSLAAATSAVLIYPLVALLLMPVDRAWETPRATGFVRGS